MKNLTSTGADAPISSNFKGSGLFCLKYLARCILFPDDGLPFFKIHIRLSGAVFAM